MLKKTGRITKKSLNLFVRATTPYLRAFIREILHTLKQGSLRFSTLKAKNGVTQPPGSSD